MPDETAERENIVTTLPRPADKCPDCVNTCMASLTVAAGVLTAWSDVVVRGYLKEHPDYVTYRLDLLEEMIAVVRSQVKAEALKWRRDEVQGGWGPPDSAALAAEHAEQVAEFTAHGCCCDWCISPNGHDEEDQP